MGGFFHHVMGFAGLGEGQHRMGHRPDPAGGEFRPDLPGEGGGDFGFICVWARAQGGAGIGDAFEHDRHQIDLDLGSGVEGQLHDPRIRGCGLYVAGNIGPADGVEDDPGAARVAQDGDKILGLEIDGAFGAEIAAEGAIGTGRGGGEDAQPPGSAQLDGGRADPPGAAMGEENAVPGPGARGVGVEDIAPDREECLWQAGTVDRADAFGERQAMARMDRHIGAIAPAIGQRHHRIARGPSPGGIGPNDSAGYFEPEQIGRALWRRIGACALDDIGPVDPGGGDLDQHFFGARYGYRALAKAQNLGAAGPGHLYHLHEFRHDPPRRFVSCHWVITRQRRILNAAPTRKRPGCKSCRWPMPRRAVTIRRMFDIRDMQLLAALARHRHFARAAEECGISQPAFSARIRNLELELGTAIVQRGNRFQGFTGAGEIALRWAHKFLADVDGLKQELGSARGALTGTLSIGVVPTALASVAQLPGVLRASHPHLAIEVISANSGQIRRGVEDFSFDAGITYLDASLPQSLLARPLYDEEYVLLCPPGLAPRDRIDISWAEAATIPLCLLTQDMRNRRIIDEVFDSVGAAPVPVMETNAFTAALAQVATGTAATIAPVRLADNLPIADNAVRLPLVAPVLTKPIGLLLARRDPELPAVAALIAALATAGPGPR